MRLSALVLVALLAVPAFCTAEQLLILCDDDGTDSYTEDIPAIIDAMSPTPTYVFQPDNGDTGTYSSDETYLNGYDMVYWYASGTDISGRETTSAEVTACQAYINGGGHMFITGYDLIGAPDDPNMADILNSSTYGDDSRGNFVTIMDTSHFITNGSYGTFTGTYTISRDDHDNLTADTAGIEIITVDGDPYSKCIYTDIGSGSVTGYVGNDSNEDFRNDGLEGLLLNWVDHIMTATSIESASLGEIKAAFK
jgi:hypothetical protein